MLVIVKRAYHRWSLLIHPDRVPEEQKAEATEKFKVISAIHSVLSNKAKRESYDKTGMEVFFDCTELILCYIMSATYYLLFLRFC